MDDARTIRVSNTLRDVDAAKASRRKLRVIREPTRRIQRRQIARTRNLVYVRAALCNTACWREVAQEIPGNLRTAAGSVAHLGDNTFGSRTIAMERKRAIGGIIELPPSARIRFEATADNAVLEIVPTGHGGIRDARISVAGQDFLPRANPIVPFTLPHALVRNATRLGCASVGRRSSCGRKLVDIVITVSGSLETVSFVCVMSVIR